MDKVSICSSALLQFGKGPIASFTPSGNNNDIIQLCANLYPQERDSLLREGFWNCAMTRAILAPDSTAPIYAYASRFKLPADFIRLYSIGDYLVGSLNCLDFRIEDGYILTVGTQLPIEYIYRNEVEATWDSKLIELMIARMMWKLAYPITQSASLRDQMRTEYERMAMVARSIDSQENPSQPMSDDFSFITGRY